MTQTIVDNPSGTNFSYYDKYINIQWSNGNYILVGMDNNNFCAPGRSGLHWFYYVGDPGDSAETGVACGAGVNDPW